VEIRINSPDNNVISYKAISTAISIALRVTLDADGSARKLF
jgi:hypothetical protein